jgi:TPR repeat protein
VRKRPDSRRRAASPMDDASCVVEPMEPTLHSFLDGDTILLPSKAVPTAKCQLSQALPILRDRSKYMYERRAAAIDCALGVQSPEAHFTLAYALMGGGGIPPRLCAPETWQDMFKYAALAAEEGHMGGIFVLAMCYLRGHGVKKDVRRSYDLLKESAQKGFSEACLFLGEIYLSSQCANKQDLAHSWFEVAAACGDMEAQCILADLLIRYRRQERQRGIELLKGAASSGYHRAQFELASWLVHGPDKDYNEARRLLLAVSNRGTDDEGGCHWYNMATNALSCWEGIKE